MNAETARQLSYSPKLLEGEQLLHVEEFNDPRPTRQPSALYNMVLLGKVQHSSELGDAGPVLAALPLEEHKNQPEFRRYEAVYGRDSLRVAADLMPYYPKLARTTLLFLAQHQGIEVSNAREEEPGRIIHEYRDPVFDPVARELTAERGWGWPYYGSIDATPEYIRTLAAYCRQPHEGIAFLGVTYKGRDNTEHTIMDSLTSAIDWLQGRLDNNPEGLLESRRSLPTGIENQVWKDSWDSYFHADGTIANHQKGVATVEAQRVAYDALLDAAELYLQFPALADKADDLKQRAEKLRTAIFKHFWVDEQGGYFILGTDRDSNGQLRQLKVKASNMGHLLHARLLEVGDPFVKHCRESVVKQLFSPELFCRNGIRTLATEEIRFRPGAYHNGSVWIWDNFLIAQGLAQHGYYDAARLLENVLLNDIYRTRRLVEFLRGDNEEQSVNNHIVDVYDYKNKRVNRVEQPPQDIQAWSVAAILTIKLNRVPHNARYLVADPQKRLFESRLLANIGHDVHPSLSALLPDLASA